MRLSSLVDSLFVRYAKSFHSRWIFPGRASVIADALSPLIPRGAVVLDVGCGNGVIGKLIADIRDDVTIKGIEVAMRPDCKIECSEFDGSVIPLDNGAVDVCILVDVLHHTQTCAALLMEASRVSGGNVLIKDHLCEGPFQRLKLTVMDWVGNRPHGVGMRGTYLSEREWAELFRSVSLRVKEWNDKLPIYSFPASLFFRRGLHFVALLERENASTAPSDKS